MKWISVVIDTLVSIWVKNVGWHSSRGGDFGGCGGSWPWPEPDTLINWAQGSLVTQSLKRTVISNPLHRPRWWCESFFLVS